MTFRSQRPTQRPDDTHETTDVDLLLPDIEREDRLVSILACTFAAFGALVMLLSIMQ